MESWNHKVAEVGSDVWRSSGPSSLLKKVHTEPVVEDHIHMAFDCLQGGRTPQPLQDTYAFTIKVDL